MNVFRILDHTCPGVFLLFLLSFLRSPFSFYIIRLNSDLPHSLFQLNVFNSRLSFSARHYSAPIFYNSKSLNCIGSLYFFKICSHIFMIFEIKLE